MLLVFSKNDLVSEALITACDRLQMDVRTVRSMEAAIDALQHPMSGGYQLIIVDGRLPRVLDSELIAR